MGDQSSVRRAALTEMMKQAVFDACVRVLLRCGVDGTTMDLVAQEAEVAKGTLYNYFKSKEELFDYVQVALFEPLKSGLEAIAMAPNLTGQEKLERIFTQTVEDFTTKQAIMRLVLAEFGAHPLALTIEDNVEHQFFIDLFTGVASDAFKEHHLADVDPKFLGHVIGGAILGLLMHRLAHDSDRCVRDDVRNFMRIFFPDPT